MIHDAEKSREELIDDYIIEHSDKEPLHLQNNYRETCLQVINPRMASGHIQGRILKMITRMIKPKRVLEIGTFTGYSALCFAEGLPQDGQIDTLEINDELEEFTQNQFNLSPYKDKINLLIGDAAQIIPTLDLNYDLIFMDADKRLYQTYYDQLIPHIPSGSFILADNTLWDGKVISPPHKMDAQTKALIDFNEKIAQDDRIEKVILPLRDGLTLIQKK